MSVKAMAWAWDQDAGSSTGKLILMALADHANDDGVCWPGRKVLARKAEVSERTTSDNINKLIERGLIDVEQRQRADGSQTTNLYVLAMGPPREDSARGGEAGDPPPGKQASTHEPSVEPSAVVVDGKVSKEDREVSSRTGASGTLSLDDTPVSRPAYTFSRKRMTKTEWGIVEMVLAQFNAAFDTDFGPQDKDQVSRVIGVIRSGGLEGVTPDALRTVLANNAKAPWWGAEKPDTVGVIFGPRTWSRARRCDGRLTGKNAVSAQRESVLSRLDDVIQAGDTP